MSFTKDIERQSTKEIEISLKQDIESGNKAELQTKVSIDKSYDSF